MPKIIKNMNDLERILELRVSYALKNTQQKIYEVIQDSISEYYKEYTPSFYDRTFKFLNSLVKTDIVKIGNTYVCEVKLSEDYLNRKYPGDTSYSKNVEATGLDVATWANRGIENAGNHGYTVNAGRDEGFWDIAIEELGEDVGIINLFVQNLRKTGLNVK